MLKFLLKKAGTLALVFLGITFLSFCLTYLAPSDAAQIQLNKTGVAPTEELLEQTREEMGLNRPLLVRYGDWLIHVLRGDMGTSLRNESPVAEELLDALPYTAALTAVSMAAVLLISVPVGILCAWKKDGFLDGAVRLVTYLFASLPSFFLALVILYLFSVRLGWLPVIGSGGPAGIVMPALVLSLSPYFSTSVTADLPDFCVHPRDFSSRVDMPPALLPGEGFSYTGCRFEMKYSLKSLMRLTVLPNISSLAQRAIRIVSAPNISGTSVRTVVPSWETIQSEKRPSRGFAVMPEKPSEPPHLRPTLSSETGISSLLSSAQASAISFS